MPLLFHSHSHLYQMFQTQLSCSYGLAFIMLFSKCLRYKSRAGSPLGLGVNEEGFINARVS